MKKTKHRIANLKITEFSKEGEGRGRWDREDHPSIAVDVPFAIPGDEVQVNLIKKKKGRHKGQVLEWKQLSNDRIVPLCQHFGSCGGCQWQMLAYEQQLRLKEEWIRSYLKPYLHEQVTWHPILPCLPPWNYRNKMELSFSCDSSGKRYLGLIMAGTRGHVFQMQECHLAQNWMLDAVHAATHWWTESGLSAYHARKNQGSLRTLILRGGERSGDRLVMLTVSGRPEDALNQAQIRQFVSLLRQATEPSSTEAKLSIFLRIQQVAKGRPTQFYEMLLYGPDHIRETIYLESIEKQSEPLHFRISPSAFFQPNTRQAEKLYSRAIQLTQILPAAIVYDLYCGIGTLGICMAGQAKEVIGIEISREAVVDARENIKLNALSHVSIHAGDVGKVLQQLAEEKKISPDVVMVDPPRTGLDARALQCLLDLKAPRLTYLSCNPKTQAENLEVLIHQGGYRLTDVQPVDPFPQTVHVENIAILTL